MRLGTAPRLSGVELAVEFLEVVAVGVETEPQLAYLQSHQCDQVQGNFFRPPLAVPELEPLLLAGASLMAPTDQPVAPPRDTAPD